MPIREIITILVVLGSTVAGLANPRIGMYGYVWFSLLRPDALSWSQGKYPYGITMAAAILIGNLRNIHQAIPSILLNPISRLFFLVLSAFTLSTIEAVDGVAAGTSYIVFMKASIMTLMLPMLFYEFEHVRKLFLLMALSLGFIGMYFGIIGVLKGGIHIISGIGGSLADSNFIGLAMVIVLPFCWYGMRMTGFKPLRIVLAVMAFGCCGTVVFTQSRGSFVGLVVVLILLTLQSRHKVLVLLLATLLTVPAAYLTWLQFSNRIVTIADPAQETSAYSRILMMRLAVDIWRDYPVFGIGPGDETLIRIAGRYDLGALKQDQAIHSLPFQLLAHLGAYGLTCVALYFGYALIYCYRSSRRMKKKFPGLEVYPNAVKVSILGYLATTLFYPRAWFEIGYMLPMFAGCWYLAEKSILASSAEAAARVPVVAPPPAPPPVPANRPAWERPPRLWSKPIGGAPGPASTARPGTQ